MLPVLTPEQKRRADDEAGDPVEVLIDRAGAAVASAAIRLLGGGYGRTAIVLAGPGNNGADGRVAADRMRERGVSVTVLDALDLPRRSLSADLVLDAAFGTGFRDDWRPPAVGDAAVLAVDVPTGLDALTGDAGEHTLPADMTVTFGAACPGHVLGDGPALIGELVVADIGLPSGDPSIHIVEGSDVAGWLPARDRGAHKWADAVRIVAGSLGMTGAGHLAAISAFRAGSGMVALSSPGLPADAPVEAVDRRVPAFDWADDVLGDLHRYHALIVGPGLGREEHTIPSVVRVVRESVVPVVVDGDGLFALSWNDAGDASSLSERELATVLTPHDGEYGRLTGGTRPGDDRITDAHRLAELTGAIVLLKGPTTIVADPAGPTLLVTNGSQRLATAGTGDVLSGVVGAFLARGMAPPEAAAAAAWVHAEAATICPPGLLAGDLPAAIAEVLARVVAHSEIEPTR